MPVHADFNLDLCRLGPEGLRTRLTDEAASLLAAKLKTPLQIGQHLVRAFEAGFETRVKPLDAALVETVLSRQINDLEPRLTRNGYDLRSLVEQFDAKPAEIRQLLSGELNSERTRELLVACAAKRGLSVPRGAAQAHRIF